MENYPEDVKRIAALGHALGNHSRSQLSEEEVRQEILSVHDKIMGWKFFHQFLSALFDC